VEIALQAIWIGLVRGAANMGAGPFGKLGFLFAMFAFPFSLGYIFKKATER
jgi:hypothetical protein